MGAVRRPPQGRPLQRGFRLSGALRAGSNGGGTTYTLTEELKSGYYGVTWLASVDGSPGEKVVVKFPKLDAIYAAGGSHKTKADLETAVQHEYEVQYAMKKNRHAARLLDYGAAVVKHRSGVQSVPFLVYEFIDGLSLDDWAKKVYAKARRLSAFTGIVEPATWFTLSTKLRAGLNHLHEERIVHGDIWPSNVMIRRKKDWAYSPEPVYIDFGKSFITDRVLDQPALKARWQKYLAPERVITRAEAKERSHREAPHRWYSPADIYSLGMVFLYLAAGESDVLIFKNLEPLPEGYFDVIDNSYYTNHELKEMVIDAVRSRNPRLYSGFPEVADIIMHCIRPEPDRRAADVVAVETVMEDCFPSSQWANCSRQKCLHMAARVVTKLRNSTILNDRVARTLLGHDVRTFYRRLRQFEGRVLTLGGGRERLIGALVRILKLLGPGDKLQALTTTSFWRKENFGAYGRFSTALRSAARRGVSVEWITLYEVNARGRANDPATTAKIRRAHSKLSEDLPPQSGCLKLKLVRASNEEVERVVRSRATFILLDLNGAPRKTRTLIIPDYTQTGGLIHAVRIWRNPKTLEDKLPAFDRYAAGRQGPRARRAE